MYRRTVVVGKEKEVTQKCMFAATKFATGDVLRIPFIRLDSHLARLELNHICKSKNVKGRREEKLSCRPEGGIQWWLSIYAYKFVRWEFQKRDKFGCVWRRKLGEKHCKRVNFSSMKKVSRNSSQSISIQFCLERSLRWSMVLFSHSMCTTKKRKNADNANKCAEEMKFSSWT